MALDCVLTPPSIVQGNKDTNLQTEGENDSDKPDDDEETDIDLEEGEILDSGEENDGPVDTFFRKEPTPEPTLPHEQYNDNELGNEELDDDRRRKKKKRRSEEEDKKPDKRSNKKGRYIDHEQMEDENMDGGWHGLNVSPSKRKSRRGDSSPQHNDGNLSGHSDDEDGTNFRDFRGEMRHRGNSSNRNSRKGRGAIHRQRMNQDRNKTKKRKGPENKRSRSLNRNRPKREVHVRPRPICKFYLDGKCHKGDECQFSHDVTMLKKKDLCKFFLNGFCAKGDSCLFMHGEFPCKFYHMGGNCFNDMGCRFSHEPLTDEMRMVLEKHLENDTFEEDKEAMDNNNSNTVMQMKRPSLLGSPPRHVKEAAEEWQQDLIQRLQLRDKKIDFGCHNAVNINTSPVKVPPFPSRLGNFYVDTLQRTPNKNMDMMGDMCGQQMIGNRGGPMINDVGNDMMNNMNDDMMNNMNNDMMNNMNNDMINNMNNDRMNNMGNDRMNNMGNDRMNNMGNDRMNNMGNDRMNNMGNERMNNMGNQMMNNMGNQMMNDMGNPMGEMGNIMPGQMVNQMMGRVPNQMGNIMVGDNRVGMNMMGNNFQAPFMNQLQDMLKQERGDVTPPRNNQTPVPTDDEELEAQEFDQFLNNRPQEFQRTNPVKRPNFYDDDDEEDVVVAGGVDELEDDQFSERIMEVKKIAVMGSSEKATLDDAVEDNESQSTIISQGQSQSPDHDENSSDVKPKVPIAVPCHLPKRTRELFLRIQQHQKKAGRNANPDGEATSDSLEKDGDESNLSQTEEKPTTIEVAELLTKEPEIVPEVKEEIKEVEDDYNEDEEDMDGAKSNWLSSDEDDDNGDQPLTDVLKKLQQLPPPPRVPTPPKISSAPIDITKMLNNIRQQATQSSSNTNFPGNQDFWQNIFSAAMPFPGQQNAQGSPQNARLASMMKNPPPFLQNKMNHKGHSSQSHNKRRGLLPQPLLPQPPSLLGPPPMQLNSLILDASANMSRDPRFRDSPQFVKNEKNVDLKKVSTARDPRLSMRDPRMGSAGKEGPNSPSQNPKPVINSKAVTNAIKSPSPPHPSTHGKPKERKFSIEKPEVEKKPVSGSPNYRLFTVTVSPLNYSSYLFATQNDKKLLNDPRLKKLLENSPSNAIQKSISLTFPPELSNVSLLTDKSSPSTSQTSILDVPKPQGSLTKTLQETRSATVRIVKKRDSTEIKSSSTPPRSSSPPSIKSPEHSKSSEMDTATDTLTKLFKPVPPPVSHLPKSFTDPRLARLHQITNPRGTRHVAIPKKKAKLQISTPIDKDSTNKPEAKTTDNKSKEIKGGSVNRKKSLDYASPLNAYPENEESSGYSSYNRRPQINRTAKINKDAPETLPISIPKLPTVEPSITEPTNEADNVLINQSLKEVFKTIDPTASPFC